MKRMLFRDLFVASTLIAAPVVISTTGCSSVYYAAWEKLGKEKRHLLKDSLEDARETQAETVTQFRDALEALQAAHGAQPGALQETYTKLKAEYDASESQAKELEGRISHMNKLSSDLFIEWETEAESMENVSLRSQSISQLTETKRNYQALRSTLEQSAAGMRPVLKQFRDYVLFLKHNLNAQSIGALKGEAHSIEMGINALVERMNGSIQEIDQFAKTLE